MADQTVDRFKGSDQGSLVMKLQSAVFALEEVIKDRDQNYALIVLLSNYLGITDQKGEVTDLVALTASNLLEERLAKSWELEKLRDGLEQVRVAQMTALFGLDHA